MKKSDFNKSIIGRRCVVYTSRKVIGTIAAVYDHGIIEIRYENGNREPWHYKAVRLLKKKQAPVYWVHESALNGNEALLFKECPLFMGEPSKKHIRVKLVRLKDEK